IGPQRVRQVAAEGRDQGGATLYDAMYRRFQEVGGKVKGVLWYQGESDSTDEAAPEYFRKFSEFIEAVRRDFEQPELPFYYVQIGRLTVTDNPLLKNWNRIQMDQLRLESALPNVGMVATVDLSMDDLIHIGTPGLKVVGHRLANRVLTDVYKIRNDDVGPRPVKAVRGTTKFGNVVKVIYEVGNGGLSSEGRLAGFSISDGQGNPLALIYNQTIDPSGEAVLLWVQGEVPEDAQLSYGRGGDPYCNLGDGAGSGAPVFGPVPIEKE
ncbi:MAG: sialate O-acetylesterase, partial [Candidatus Hydrogenedentes bacterium]|nr:sialate O-acetylesterase [Candidatus Hydrogenedentota bacterium]